MAKVISFPLSKVKQPFQIRKRYTVDNILSANFSTNMTSYELSEQFNRQVIMNAFNFKLMKNECDDIQDGKYKDKLFKFIGQDEIYQYNLTDENLIKACDKFTKAFFEISHMDTLSRDDDILNNISEFKNLHVIVLLDMDNEYNGHIYAWISPVSQSLICIGIRSKIDMIFSRAEGKGIYDVSKYLLEGARLLAINFKLDNIIIPKPLSRMQVILDRVGFQTQIIPTDILKSPIKLFNASEKETKIYMYSNIQQSFTKEIIQNIII